MQQFFNKELDVTVRNYTKLYSMEQIVKTFYKREEEFKNNKTKSFMKRQRYANRIIYSLNGKDSYGFFMSNDNNPCIITIQKMYGGGIESSFTMKLVSGEFLVGVGKLQGKRLLGETVIVYDNANWLYTYSSPIWDSYRKTNTTARKLVFNPDFANALASVKDANLQKVIVNNALNESKAPRTESIDIPDYLGNFLILE